VSSLSDRIRAVVAPGSERPRAPATTYVASGLSRTNPELERALGGEWCDDCFVVERRFAATARHGHDTVGAMAERIDDASAHASWFAAGAAAQAPFVFFDLETTGLSGGAGTQAFLVGCASFAADASLVVRQFLLTSHADERSILQRVARILDEAGALVSFNGKSFDAPMLETRYAFHRLEWTGAELPHLDVLHPARRFWGGARGVHPSESDCSLVSLERQIVGARRTGDVPGFEIPSRYFQFVRTGDPRPLAAVLDHNRLDLLTLAALTARLLHLARSGSDAARSAREALALGCVFARAGLDVRARAAFERSLELCAAPAGAYDPTRIDALRALAIAWRRARQFDRAARCWSQLLEIRGCPPPVAREATEALAIHHEHRVRDLSTARMFALRGLEACDQPMPPASWTRAVQHRLARINRKMNGDAPLWFTLG
jgi:uncharacterized protein